MFQNNFKFTKRIAEKLLKKHRVTIIEVGECFLNRIHGLLEDTRLDHRTEPPTLWFIAETDHGRLLKVVFIEHTDGTYEIKTAYEPNENEVKIYERFA
ncbi:MAG: ADP-ribosyl-(dinitrogen reductase) hydrolase [Gammaproteobacteria bacterium]